MVYIGEAAGWGVAVRVGEGHMSVENDLRTNSFLKLFPPGENTWAGKVTISFGHPIHGWILMSVTCTAYLQGVIINLSDVFNPFPEMIRWLDDIVSGNLPSEFEIEEEGQGKRFRATPISEIEFLFEIADSNWYKEKSKEEPLYMYVRVATKQFLAEFIRRWDELVQEKYNPAFWEGVDLRTMDVSKIRKAG